MRRPPFRPVLTRLEPRELMANELATVVASPSLLSPPNNRFVRVEVTGFAVENRENVVPDVDFQVVDEYRRFEPAGRVKLERVSATAFSFKFSVVLQAKRSSQDKAGRQYYVILGSSDMDNSFGVVLPVLVPFNKVKPGQALTPAKVQTKLHIKV